MTNVAAVSAENFRPKTEDTLGLGAALALAAHLLLVLALAFGVSWRTHTTAVAEAEMWSEIPTAAAPPAEAPPPPPPEPVVEKTEPPPPVAQVEPEPMPEPEAEIPKAPEPKKKVKHKKEKKPEPPVVAKVEPKPVPKPKKVSEPKETFITEKPVASKKSAPLPASTPTVSSAEREAQRKSAMQRMMKDLGSLGTSEHSAGPSANYVGKLRARIIPNITFLMDEGSGNPTAFVEIRCAPDGTILSRRLLDPSGSPAWDKAVLDGIDKTRSLPFDEKGRLPDTVFQIGISPRDR